MLSEKHITPLLINLIFVKVLLTYPKTVIENSANAAWIQILYNTLLALLFFVSLARICGKKRNIPETAEINGGKPLKIFTGVCVVLLLIINSAPIIRIFPESVKIILLRETDTEIIVTVMAAAAGLGAYLGLESLARMNRIFLPIAAAVFLGLIVLLIPKYRISNLTPIFGNGGRSIFVNGVSSLSLFSDIIVLNLLIPFAKNFDAVKRSGIKAIIIAGTAAALTSAAYCLSFSYPTSEDFIIPAYQMTRLISISNFLSRFEAFFEFIWSILTLIYSAVYIYMICYVLQTTFSLKYLKPLILPVTVLVYFVSLVPQSVMQMIKWNTNIGKYSYIAVFLIMLIFSKPIRRSKNET